VLWRWPANALGNGFVIHPVLDCVLDWRHDNPKAEIVRIVVRGNPLLGDRADRPDVSTGRESQVSVQHAAAVALLTGNAGLDEFSDARVRRSRRAGLAQQGRVDPRSSFLHHRSGGRNNHG